MHICAGVKSICTIYKYFYKGTTDEVLYIYILLCRRTSIVILPEYDSYIYVIILDILCYKHKDINNVNIHTYIILYMLKRKI